MFRHYKGTSNAELTQHNRHRDIILFVLILIFCKTLPFQIVNCAVIWMEKAVATHSSTLAWKIPWMEEPGGLQSMGSWRVGHDWATSLSLFTFTHWRRKWQPTPVFLPGESQGRRSLVGCRLWGRKELDTTEVTLQQQQHSLCSLMYFVFSILPQWPVKQMLSHNVSNPLGKLQKPFPFYC